MVFLGSSSTRKTRLGTLKFASRDLSQAMALVTSSRRVSTLIVRSRAAISQIDPLPREVKLSGSST